MKRIILSLMLCIILTGCSKGAVGLWETANPQTTVKISPLTKSISIFSNDGRVFSMDNLKLSWGKDQTLEVENFSMKERSVENRIANVEQLKMQAAINETNWNGMAAVVEKSVGAAIGGVVDVLTQGVKVSTKNTPLGDASLEVGGNKIRDIPSSETTNK